MRGGMTREGNDDERGDNDDTTTTDTDANTRPRRHSSPGCFSCFSLAQGTRLLDRFLFSFFFCFAGPTHNPPHAYEHLLVGWFDNCR